MCRYKLLGAAVACAVKEAGAAAKRRASPAKLNCKVGAAAGDRAPPDGTMCQMQDGGGDVAAEAGATPSLAPSSDHVPCADVLLSLS